MTDITSPNKQKMAIYHASKGPFQVNIIPTIDGETAFRLCVHTHASIAVDGRLYPPGHTPPVDEDGYYQPDGESYVPSYRIDQAWMIAEALSAFPQLVDDVETLRETARIAVHSLEVLVKRASSIEGPTEM